MKTYYISVTETLNKIVEVHAEDSSEALQKAEDAYYNGEIELDYNDMVDTEFEKRHRKVARKLRQRRITEILRS